MNRVHERSWSKSIWSILTYFNVKFCDQYKQEDGTFIQQICVNKVVWDQYAKLLRLLLANIDRPCGFCTISNILRTASRIVIVPIGAVIFLSAVRSILYYVYSYTLFRRFVYYRI